MRLRFRTQARADIDEIRRYLRKRSPSGARNVLRSIRASVRFIAENPLASEETDDPDVRVKVIVEYPYKIVYSVHPDFIEVLHIRIQRDGPGKESDRGDTFQLCHRPAAQLIRTFAHTSAMIADA